MSVSKTILKFGLLSLVVFFAANSIYALLLMRNDIASDKIVYMEGALLCAMALMLSVAAKKTEKQVFALFPLFLLNAIPMIAFRSVSIKTALIIVSEILVFFAVQLFKRKKKSIKKRNINTIRRDYERLRKK